jgi:hypothetical protein
MGLFDFLGGGGFKKHVERAGDRRAQALDRMASIEFLVADGSEEAVAALLKRFRFVVDPSITDEEEKDRAFRGIVALGEGAVGPIRRYARTAESLIWPLKMLDEILEEESYVGEILDILSRFDTDYERDPQRKIDLLSLCEERRDPRIAAAAGRFLQDANETVRFHAAGAVLHQQDEPGTRESLLDHLVREESVRIRGRILEGFASLGWGVQGKRAEVEKLLPKGWAIDRAGLVKAPGKK